MLKWAPEVLLAATFAMAMWPAILNHPQARDHSLMNFIHRAVLLSGLLAGQAFSQTAPAAQAPAPAPAPVPAQAPAASPYSRQATIFESAGMVHISANSPRPLEQILNALQVKYKWIVSYEDPQFTAQQDLTASPTDPHMQLPSGGSFAVDVSGAEPDQEKTLKAIVDSYNHSKNPGRFEVRKTTDGRFYVAGVAATDDKGKISAQPPVFDTPITIPAEERTITETLTLICKEISTRSHVPVVIGVSPRSLLEHATVKIGGNAVSARDLMVQSLADVRTHPYWRLLYDPNTKGYYLDLHSSHV
jgi:hypothetical protein